MAEQETKLEVIEAETKETAEPDFKGAEREMAIKHGMIKDDKKEQEDEQSKQSKDEAKEDITKEKEVKEEITTDDELTDEQEKEQIAKWNKNETALYIKAKKARARMKAAELERDYLKTKTLYAEQELEKVKKAKPKEEVKAEEFDEFGEPKEVEIPEDERPLTLKEYRELESKKERDYKDKLDKQKVINAKSDSYWLESKSAHDDMEAVIDLTTDIFNNYKNIFPADKIQEVEAKMKNWVSEVTNITEPNSKNFVELAYEIGKMHPKYGKKEEVKNGKESETLSEEKIEKILKPKARTSASLSGSGGQVTSELTLEQAARLSATEYGKLSKETREKLLKQSCKT